MNKYYVAVEEDSYFVLDTTTNLAYRFLLDVKCGPEISVFDIFKPSEENMEEYLLVSYEQLVVITEAKSIIDGAKAAREAAIQTARKSTPEYRLKLALTCLLEQTRRLSDNDAVYDDFNLLSMDLDEIQDICDGIEVEL